MQDNIILCCVMQSETPGQPTDWGRDIHRSLTRKIGWKDLTARIHTNKTSLLYPILIAYYESSELLSLCSLSEAVCQAPLNKRKRMHYYQALVKRACRCKIGCYCQRLPFTRAPLGKTCIAKDSPSL